MIRQSSDSPSIPQPDPSLVNLKESSNAPHPPLPGQPYPLPGEMPVPLPGEPNEEDNGQVVEPMNAFSVWSRTERRKLALKYPNMLKMEITKLLNAEWSRMTEEEKSPYIQESERLRTIHSQQYPADYSYKPRKGREGDPPLAPS